MEIFIVSAFCSFVTASATHILQYAWIDHISKQDIMQGVSGLARRYFQERQVDWKLPPIGNLAAYISQTALNHHCLIIVDNPRQVDFSKSFENPVILRTPYPLMFRNGIFSRVIYGPANVAPQNISRSWENLFDCPLSKLFRSNSFGKSADIDLCYHLNIKNLSRVTKLWNCYIQVYHYPTEFYFEEYYLRVWRSHFTHLYYHNTFPSQFPPIIQIFVETYSPDMGKYEKLRAEASHRLMPFSRQGVRRSLGGFCHVRFLHFSVKTIMPTNNLQIILKPAKGHIVHVDLIRICPCWNKLDKLAIQVDKALLHDFEKLLEINLPRFLDFNWIWDILFHGKAEGNVKSRMMHFLNICNTLHLSRQRDILLSSPRDNLAYAFAGIWLSIMGNYTVLKFSTSSSYKVAACNSDSKFFKRIYVHAHIDFEFLPYVEKLYVFPYFVQDELSTMRFISCGKRGLTSLPLEELTRVFDKWIWLLILVSTTCVLISLWSQFDTGLECWSTWLATMKVLLEQGNPFQESLIKSKKMRWIIGLFLLMGIVLSSAYKNTNVHNMIAPRKPIPLEFFKELIQDNFSIFTRTNSLRISLQMEEDEVPKWIKFMSMFLNGTGPVDVLVREEFAFLIISEIAAVVSNLVSAYRELYPLIRNTKHAALGNMSLVLSQVSSKSNFVTPVSEEMNTLIESWHPYIDIYNMTTRNEALQEILKDFKEVESRILISELRRCDKVAIVLPEHLCYTFMKHSKTGPKGSYLSVGKDAFRDVEWMFSLKGILPVGLPKRIKAVHEVGLWERWLLPVKEKRVPDLIFEATAARIDGNGILIFALWVIGLGGSIICMVLESLYGRAIVFQVLCTLFTFKN